MIIRVRHSGGTARVTIGEEKTLSDLCVLVEDSLVGEERVESRLSRDPGGRDRLAQQDATLLSLGLSHGSMIHLQPVEIREEEQRVVPRHDIEEDPEMAEAIAIARAADEEEDRPRAPDGSVRDQLIGGQLDEEEEEEYDDEFSLEMMRQARNAVRDDIALSQREFRQMPTAESPAHGEDVELQRALYISAQGSSAEAGDDDLERNLAANEQHVQSTEEPAMPRAQDDERGLAGEDEDDEDVALQSALLDIEASRSAREAAEEAELKEALRISAMAAQPP